MTKLINAALLAATIFTLSVGFVGLASAPARIPASAFDAARFLSVSAAKPIEPSLVVASR